MFSSLLPVRISIAFLCWAALLPVAVKGVSIVVPNSLANTEAGNNNTFPFSISSSGLSSQRYQQAYDASQFAAVPGGGYITQIIFRPDGGGQGSAFSSTLPSIAIQLSSTGATVDGLSTTFDNNIGPDALTVYFGSLLLSSAFTGPTGGPKNFDIVINLKTPFFYNPASGNLLMDVSNYGGGSSTYFDLIHSFGDSVCRLYTVLPNGVNQTTGMTDSSGLVTEFTIIPPTLSLNNSVSNIVLSWPGKAVGWHLQSAPSPSGDWSDFAATIQVQGASNVVTFAPTNNCQFFRLRYP
jgi:hypothetical protein